MIQFKKNVRALAQAMSKVYLIVAYSMVPSLSHAQSIENILNHTITYLQGGLARTVGILCILIAGYLCLFRQQFPKEYFMMILVGMGLIFGSSTLYSTIFS